MTTLKKKSNRLLVWVSAELHDDPRGQILLPMAACRFGPDLATSTQPIWLQHTDADGLLGIAGQVKDLLGTAGALYGTLNFSDKEIAAQWENNELDFSLQLKITKSFTVQAGQEYQGFLGPIIVATVWVPTLGMLTFNDRGKNEV